MAGFCCGGAFLAPAVLKPAIRLHLLANRQAILGAWQAAAEKSRGSTAGEPSRRAVSASSTGVMTLRVSREKRSRSGAVRNL